MNLTEVLVLFRRWLSPEPVLPASMANRESIASITGVGRTHRVAARAAVDQRLFVSAAALYGHAIGCFLHAKRLLADADSSGTAAAGSNPESAAVAAAAFVAASPFGSTEAGRDALLLLQEQPIGGARPDARARRGLAGLDRVATSLGAELYPTTEADVRGLRIRRQLAVGLVLLVAVAGIGRWLTAARNVARGKAVTASSVRFGAPQALVNGAIEWGTFGLHTASGREWATIDLGDFYSLAYAEIYGRGDGHVESGLPLSVDLSDDGVSFRPAGACRDIYTQATPCVVSLARQRARFVRVAASEVVLSEVEVYATP